MFDECTNSPSQYATFLTKFDSAGTRLWSRLVAARNETQGRQVCFSPSDNALYVAGMAYVLDQQFALTKFDLSGNQLWHVTWGSSVDDYAEAVGVSDSGEIYVAGASLDGFDGWTAAPQGSAVVSKWVDLTETTDSDGDGMTDLWEIRELGNLTHDGTADSDLDGARDRDEFVAGTSPTNRNSCFQIDTCFRSEDRDTVLAWRSVLGRTYAVDVSTNLDHGWTTNVETWIGTGSQLHYTNHNDGERSFFRLKAQQTGK